MDIPKSTKSCQILNKIDLSKRIKSLKNKKIKIRRIIKKDDGTYSLRNSLISLRSEKSLDLN